MYAVIESGGKQHRVEEGEILRLEKLDAAAGDKLKFDKILLVGEGKSVKIGKPYVKGSQVTAEVVKEGRGGKIKIIKFHRRKHYKRQQGHRQWFTEVKIIGIKAETKAKAKARRGPRSCAATRCRRGASSVDCMELWGLRTAGEFSSRMRHSCTRGTQHYPNGICD